MLLALFSGCTNYIVIPISEYDSADFHRVKSWNVRTVDGRIYSVKRFSIENSEFIILETDNSSKPYQDIFLLSTLSKLKLLNSMNFHMAKQRSLLPVLLQSQHSYLSLFL
jgi:hypothetical protein